MSVFAATMPIEPELIPLTMLGDGRSARVDQVLGRGDLVHRLCEMGLRGGAEVEMVCRGCSCIIRLGGQKLGLRSDELSCVMVRVGACPA